MEQLYRLLLWAALAGGTVQQGYAPHYAPGLMTTVSRNRDLAPVACMVSSPTYSIGDWVYVYGLNTQALRWCRITDVSAPADRARHLRTRRYVELAFENTRELCGSTRERVIDCPVIVVHVDG